jgi:hypothetical protein
MKAPRCKVSYKNFGDPDSSNLPGTANFQTLSLNSGGSFGNKANLMRREGLSFRGAVDLSSLMIFGRYSVGAWSAGGTLGRDNKLPVGGVGEVGLVAGDSVLRCFSAEGGFDCEGYAEKFGDGSRRRL